MTYVILRSGAVCLIFIANLLAIRPASGQIVENPPRSLVADETGNFLQPDYNAWKKIKKGMKKDEVLKILGGPIIVQGPPKALGFLLPANAVLVDTWQYGWLHFSDKAIPRPDEFALSFSKGEVMDIEDPFGGRLSDDGKLTVPKVRSPENMAKLNQFPHVADLLGTIGRRVSD